MRFMHGKKQKTNKFVTIDFMGRGRGFSDRPVFFCVAGLYSGTLGVFLELIST